MFSVGQKVWHRTGRRSGIVLDIDGDQVFIEQENGAEAQFPARDLMATPPAGGASATATTRSAGPAISVAPSRVLRAGDITPEHQRVLASVPLRTVQAVATVFDRRPGGGKFVALDVAGKLNAIAQITAVPYRTMREFSDRPGELGLMMGKGLADSQRSG